MTEKQTTTNNKDKPYTLIDGNLFHSWVLGCFHSKPVWSGLASKTNQIKCRKNTKLGSDLGTDSQV